MFPVSEVHGAAAEVLLVVPVIVVVVKVHFQVTFRLVAPFTVAVSVSDWLTMTVAFVWLNVTVTTFALPLLQPFSQSRPAAASQMPASLNFLRKFFPTISPTLARSADLPRALTL
jgi:hypothetical protein